VRFRPCFSPVHILYRMSHLLSWRVVRFLLSCTRVYKYNRIPAQKGLIQSRA
jgi:hypothetical protein